MKPLSVTVVKSINPSFFVRDAVYSFLEFEHLAHNAAITNNENPGYTEVILRLSTDDELQLTLPLSPRGVPSLQKHLLGVRTDLVESLPPTRLIMSEDQEYGAWLLDVINDIDWSQDEKSPIT